MDKLQQMNLVISELVSSKAAEIVSKLRRHDDSTVGTTAKALRSFWKEVTNIIEEISLYIVTFLQFN